MNETLKDNRYYYFNITRLSTDDIVYDTCLVFLPIDLSREMIYLHISRKGVSFCSIDLSPYITFLRLCPFLKTASSVLSEIVLYGQKQSPILPTEENRPVRFRFRKIIVPYNRFSASSR